MKKTFYLFFPILLSGMIFSGCSLRSEQVSGQGNFSDTSGASVSSSNSLKKSEETETINIKKYTILNECSGTLTPSTAEGPYYKELSPKRKTLLETGISGERLILLGYVFDQDCKPISNAWLDFWQADGNGKYDNSGYKLRGQQYTDEDGRFILETVIPGIYSGRTEHIHVKVKANNISPELTTQLFFPNSSQNQSDSIFKNELLITLSEAIDGEIGKIATYNFIVTRK